MNPYLLAFSIYALLITPITLHVSVRVGRQVRYRLRAQAAGLPFLRKIKEPQPQEEHTVHEEDVARTLSEPWIWPALRAIGLKRLRRALHAVHLESAYLHVRFSFDDAAVTALCYAALAELIASAAELATGLLFEHAFGVRLWSYRDCPHNLFGYVCLPASVGWGFLIPVALQAVWFPLERRLALANGVWLRAANGVLACALVFDFFLTAFA